MLRKSSRDDLRALLRARRSAVDTASRIAAAAALPEHLGRIPRFGSACHVAGYWAVQGELPLSGVVARIDRDPGKSFYLPRIAANPDPVLEFAPWCVGDPAPPNRFGIPEPAGAGFPAHELDVVLLPLVGFDRRGHRLGTGGGYYDRSFAFRRECADGPLLVGVGFACQEASDIEAEAWDVPLDWVVTEREAICCREAAIGAQ